MAEVAGHASEQRARAHELEMSRSSAELQRKLRAKRETNTIVDTRQMLRNLCASKPHEERSMLGRSSCLQHVVIFRQSHYQVWIDRIVRQG